MKANSYILGWFGAASVAFFIIGFYNFRNNTKQIQQEKSVLEILKIDLFRYIDYLHEKYPNDPRINRLKDVSSKTTFRSLSRNDDDVGYSIDKGSVLAVCTDDGPTNEAVFVLLHELSHIVTDEWGHTPLFWKNFAFLLEQAQLFGWYKAVNYTKTPKSICGTFIHSNPGDFV